MKFYNGKSRLAAGLVLGLNAMTAQAALFDRGSGLIYDDVLNVTWLQDANYAKTSGYDADGLMTWRSAKTWADNLVYHDSIRNIDYSDWRLPSVKPVNGTVFNYNQSFDGSTDGGHNGFSFNITSPNSELAHLFNVELQNPNYYLPTGAYNPNPNWTGTPNATFQDAAYGNTANTFSNLKSYFYWTGTEYLADGAALNSWAFSTETGYQFSSDKSNLMYAWAVREGDVAPVPVPGAIWMFGSGLLGLLRVKSYRVIRTRFKNT